jgi:hypothetical protein
MVRAGTDRNSHCDPACHGCLKVSHTRRKLHVKSWIRRMPADERLTCFTNFGVVCIRSFIAAKGLRQQKTKRACSFANGGISCGLPSASRCLCGPGSAVPGQQGSHRNRSIAGEKATCLRDGSTCSTMEIADCQKRIVYVHRCPFVVD